MSYVIDQSTRNINDHLSTKYDSIFKEVLALVYNPKTLFVAPPKYTQKEKVKFYIESGIQIHIRMKEICARYHNLSFLNLVRKIPFLYIEAFNKHLPISYNKILVNDNFNKAVLLSTDMVLLYSIDELNNQVLAERGITDSLRLLLLAVLFVHVRAYARGGWQFFECDENGSEKLVEHYRSQRNSVNPENVSDNSSDNGIIYLLLLDTIKPYCQKIKIYYPKKKQLGEMQLVNFFPVSIKHELIFEEFKYLAKAGFADIYGLSYEKFCDCFTLLNIHISQILNKIKLDKPLVVYGKTEESILQFVCQITENALIKINHDELIEHYHRHLARFPELSLMDFKCFIERMTFDKKYFSQTDIDQEIAPFLFYADRSNDLLWDIMRHRALYESLSMRLFTGGDKDGNTKGAAYEEYVATKIRTAFPEIQGFKPGVIIYSSLHLKLMDIDIGFVFNKILYLLEVKAIIPKLGEILGYFDKSDWPIKILDKYKRLSQEYNRQILDCWSDYEIVSIENVVITHVPQFIPSFDEQLWLKQGKIPRICVIDKFIKYLKYVKSASQS